MSFAMIFLVFNIKCKIGIILLENSLMVIGNVRRVERLTTYKEPFDFSRVIAWTLLPYQTIKMDERDHYEAQHRSLTFDIARGCTTKKEYEDAKKLYIDFLNRVRLLVNKNDCIDYFHLTVIPRFRERNLGNDFDLGNGLKGTELPLPLNVPYYCFKE
ncbi:hypothetical protein EDC96DRAFT_544687 [Choanephora cucurbitarum]|nr:hypothetical protein EDC96DRAFT_544687 [Choanephora cucurbitarum]